MTDFVQQVRELLDRTARNGRRRWLCARVPCYLEAFDPLGLDLPAMVAAGLDIVTVSAFYFTAQQTDLPAIRRLVPGAAVYLELCHAIANGKRPPGPGYDIAPFRRATPEQIYTAANLAYARGADGVNAFNFAYYREHGGPGRGPFAEPPFHIFKRLGDPAWLARQPQTIFWRPVGRMRFADRRCHVRSAPANLPPSRSTWHRLRAAARRGSMKLLKQVGKPDELYDLATDLTESKDLAREKPELVAELNKELATWER